MVRRDVSRKHRKSVVAYVSLTASMLTYLGSVAGILLGLVTFFSVLLAPASQPMPIHQAASARMRPIQSTTGRHNQSLSTSRAEGDSATQAVSTRYGRKRKRVAHANSRRRKSGQVVARDRVNEWPYVRERHDLPRGNSYAQGASGDVRGLW